MLADIPALFTASTLVVRLRPRSSLKIDYQSRLYEGDANLSEASVHYAEIQDTINNQRERIGWRAQFDRCVAFVSWMTFTIKYTCRLRIERGQLAMDFFTYRSAGAQADALARAERYRTNAKELNNTVTVRYPADNRLSTQQTLSQRRRTTLLSRPQPVNPLPWRVPRATYSTTMTGPVSCLCTRIIPWTFGLTWRNQTQMPFTGYLHPSSQTLSSLNAMVTQVRSLTNALSRTIYGYMTHSSY